MATSISRVSIIRTEIRMDMRNTMHMARITRRMMEEREVKAVVEKGQVEAEKEEVEAEREDMEAENQDMEAANQDTEGNQVATPIMSKNLT